MYLDKQIHMDIDTIVSFVTQNGPVSERSSCHVMLIRLYTFIYMYRYVTLLRYCWKEHTLKTP